MKPKIGVIGGSGLYEMEGLDNVKEVAVDTPFGPPADQLITGELQGVPVVFLPRHGRGHRFLPTEVPYRANICALKILGVTHVISVSACGSLQEQFKPGDIVVIDQLFDRTRHRVDTFFGNGIVAHVGFGDPICGELAKLMYDTGVKLGITMHRKGTYVCMEGPQFSTRAESETYRARGFHVIGMTNYTEARLAREAELCYATLALVTDYDCWKSHEESVDATSVVEVMQSNVIKAKKIVAAVIPQIQASPDCACHNALAVAIVTDPKVIPAETKKKLQPIIGRYIK
jgi:5'-methylthioadenosine phosphorylase